MTVDAHFHAWRPARGDYGWLTPALGPICRDVEIAHWRAEAAPLGVRGGVLVQAAPTPAETEFLLALAAQEPDVLGVVGWADLAAGDAVQQVEALARRPGLKALRPMLQDIADPDWILQPALGPALDAMAGHGLAFDALVRGVHLPRVRELARRHPGLRIVIDHGAKPAIAQGEWQPWAREMDRIAGETDAVCKLSGLLTEAGALAQEPREVLPWMQHLLRAFGPQRLLWGSDWPVLELAGRYDGWWRLCNELAADLGAADRAAVFGGNARRVYRLDEPPAPQAALARAFRLAT
jgi:L-fuconolactonase